MSIQIRFCRVGWCCCWWIVRLLLSDAKIWKLSNNNLTEYLQHIYWKSTLWKSDYFFLDDFKFLVWIHFSMPVQREIFYFRIGKSFWHRVLCFEDAAARWGDPLMLVGRSFVLSIWKTVVAVFSWWFGTLMLVFHSNHTLSEPFEKALLIGKSFDVVLQNMTWFLLIGHHHCCFRGWNNTDEHFLYFLCSRGI